MSHNVNDKTQESKTYSYTVKPYTMPYTRYRQCNVLYAPVDV